jgi:hypothetical protein
VEAAGGDTRQVNLEAFRYPGPRPQSRETALLMLADGCEARVRAEHPKDEAELRKIIQSVIAHRMDEGALKDTELTLRDLAKIEDSFVATLRGIYHPRIQYPSLEREAQSTEPALPPGETSGALPEGTSPLLEASNSDAPKTNGTQLDPSQALQETGEEPIPPEFHDLLPRILSDSSSEPPAEASNDQDAQIP